MPSKLNNRVSRLEKDGHGEGRTLLVWVEIGESHEDAIKRAGLEPTGDDLLVFIRRFGITAEGEPT